MEKAQELKRNILLITNDNLDVKILNSKDIIFILLGEDHYAMDEFYRENDNSLENLYDTISKFVIEQDAKVFLERQEFDELENDQYNAYMNEHLGIEFVITKEKSILKHLNKKLDPQYLTKFDIRNKIDPILGRNLSEILNIVCNLYSVMKLVDDDSLREQINDDNNAISNMIITFIEEQFIKPMILYMLKKKEYYYSFNLIVQYDYIMNEIVKEFNDLIKFNHKLVSNLSLGIEMEDEFYDILHNIIFRLPGLITDLNLFNLVLHGNKINLIFGGKSHTDNLNHFLINFLNCHEV